jgi:hypothetical protein
MRSVGMRSFIVDLDTSIPAKVTSRRHGERGVMGRGARIEKDTGEETRADSFDKSGGGGYDGVMKPFTYIAVGVFALVALLHVLRLLFGWEATIAGLAVPLWVSLLGAVIAGGLAVMVWRESRG